MTVHRSATRPALAARGIDRAAAERAVPELLDGLRADASTRVLVLSGDRAPMRDGRLALVPAAMVPDGAEWALLGRDADGSAIVAAVFDAAVLDADAEPSALFPAESGRIAWASLRAVGGTLEADDAALFVEALSLGRWLLDAPYCPFCGTRTHVHSAGWSRLCPSCGREHFPRTDPAVIMIVTSATDPDRLLLGSNALWGADRFSCFAGFVEAGESLETAVARELEEEAGIPDGDVVYRSSQAWPYPRSLMLGFEAQSANDALARPDGEEIAEVRWFTRAEIAAALADAQDADASESFLLPGPSSIAYRLIADWCASG